jgi:hypothetical protein
VGLFVTRGSLISSCEFLLHFPFLSHVLLLNASDAHILARQNDHFTRPSQPTLFVLKSNGRPRVIHKNAPPSPLLVGGVSFRTSPATCAACPLIHTATHSFSFFWRFLCFIRRLGCETERVERPIARLCALLLVGLVCPGVCSRVTLK